jgi:4-hydroxy-tetrahydrodipicolinate synthase
MTALPPAPFGRVLTAMVTPFTPDGELDLTRAAELASRLVDAGNDGLVISGTTGEAPTTSDAEKELLLRAVVDAVGDRATIVAGVGTNDTAHSTELAKTAEKAGADGVLVVTPYYSRPPQAGVIRHVETVVGATGLPAMLYDIPVRSGIALETETIVTLAGHEQIVAVKDAKLDFVAASWVLARTDLAYYSGDDPSTLPLLAVGGCGVVGTSTHVTAAGTQELVAAVDSGDLVKAREINARLLPAYTGIFRTQGTILVKAALDLLGFPVGPVRLPLVDATAAEREQLAADLEAAGIADVFAETHTA